MGPCAADDDRALSSFEWVCCPVCGVDDARRVHAIQYAGDGVLRLLDIQDEAPHVDLLECAHCGHRYANPQIKAEMMDRYYSQINSEYYAEERGVEDALATEHARVREMVERAIPSGRILEVGCGYGHLLAQFEADRWQRRGIEPSPHAAGYAREHLGLDVVEAFPDRTICPPESADVVLMFDVIEHLKNPVELLGLLHDALSPNGMLVIGTGNADSLNARLSRKRWGYFGSWEHISFFTPASITTLLEQVGFERVDITKAPYAGSSAENVRNVGSNVVTHSKNMVKLALNRFGNGSDYRLGHYHLAFDHMLIVCRNG